MSCTLPDDLPWSALLQARDLLERGARALAFAQLDTWSCVDGDAQIPDGARAVLAVEVDPGGLSDELAAKATLVTGPTATAYPTCSRPTASRSTRR